MRATGTATREPEKPKPQVKVCVKCGRPEPITAIFCSNCSSRLDRNEIIKEVVSTTQQQNELCQLRQDIADMRTHNKKLERAIELLYQHLEEKTKQEIDAVKA